MRRLALITLFSAACFWPSTFAQETYTPPEVSSAGDAYTPYNVVFDGLFVLDIGLSDEGDIQRIQALRDPGGMIGAAKNSVRTWKFQSASERGKPVASRLTAAFVYRPANYGNAGAVPPKDFAPVIPSAPSEDDSSDYVPVGILTFAYPDYPVNSVIWGSVVAQVTVDSKGDVKDVTLLHALANFDSFAKEALKNWRFRAATLHGKPVTAKIVVAFIFQSPYNSN